MTCRRDAASLQHVIWQMARALGEGTLAARWAVSPQRVRQLHNPNRPDLRLVEQLIDGDAAMAGAGQGTPFLDWLARTYEARGIAAPDRHQRRARRLEWLLRRVVRVLDAALNPPAGMAPGGGAAGALAAGGSFEQGRAAA